MGKIGDEGESRRYWKRLGMRGEGRRSWEKSGMRGRKRLSERGLGGEVASVVFHAAKRETVYIVAIVAGHIVVNAEAPRNIHGGRPEEGVAAEEENVPVIEAAARRQSQKSVNIRPIP